MLLAKAQILEAEKYVLWALVPVNQLCHSCGEIVAAASEFVALEVANVASKPARESCQSA